MSEADFWASLEYRLCQEFAGLRERRWRSFWCDRFHPHAYLLEGRSPRITGQCWICREREQSEWDFTLLLPRPYRSRDEIDWGSLLPPAGVTRWMAFDERRRYIEIEPSVATPDLTETGMEADGGGT